MSGVEIVAHRGANDLAPENSLAAALLCVERGVDWLEIDVRSTRDGVMYNLHDRTLARTSGGTVNAPLSSIPAADADAIDIGSWFSDKFAGERLPRVATLLEQLGNRINFFFDVKDADLRALVALVQSFGLQERSFFWFGNHLEALRFRRVAPELTLKVNAASTAGIVRAGKKFGARIIECGVSGRLPEMVETAHGLGMRLMVMTGSSDRAVFRTIIDSGADMVNVDHVDAFIAERATRPGASPGARPTA